MLVVIDTNIIVSSLISDQGFPAQIVNLILEGKITSCLDIRILEEYLEVLSRPKFDFNKSDVDSLIYYIEMIGFSVVAEPLDVDFSDESDKRFYEVAKHFDAVLITGNLRHFPSDSKIMSAKEFIKYFFKI